MFELFETSSFLFDAKVQLHGYPPTREFPRCPVHTVQELRKNLKSEDIPIDIDHCVTLVQDKQCPDWKDTVTLERIEQAQVTLLGVLRVMNNKYEE
jgi:hypothetical protein